jgi:hypothetical protein
MPKRITSCATAGVLLVLGIAPLASASTGRAGSRWENCTKVNQKYSHGVGRRHAHDHTASGTDPVTNFKHSTRLYKIAMSHNSGLDGDKDGIACERH